MMPIDPVEIYWLNHYGGQRFRTILIGTIGRYGREAVARALIAHARAAGPNVTSIAAAPHWAKNIRLLKVHTGSPAAG